MDFAPILAYLISVIVGLVILYFIIKAAVRNGTVEAWQERERLAKIRQSAFDATKSAGPAAEPSDK